MTRAVALAAFDASFWPAPLVCCLSLWLFALGSVVGSFLNVVIYRLPAGMSLVHPRSCCPACQVAIRPRDNLPIFGWLALRGRCRNCRATISPRYPAVELAVAILFVFLAFVEPLSGGANLPPPGSATGPSAATRSFDPALLWGIYAFHLVLLCALGAAALTEYDGHRLSARLAAPTLAVGFLPPLGWSGLRPVQGSGPSAGGLVGPEWLVGATDGLVGLGAGLLLGCLAWPATGIGPSGKAGRAGVALSLAWSGVYLGWQAAAALAATAASAWLVLCLAGRRWAGLRRIPWTVCLAAAAVAWIVAWRGVTAQWPVLGHEAGIGLVVAAGAGVAVLSWLTWKFAPQ